jgi:hypothetical protein
LLIIEVVIFSLSGKNKQGGFNNFCNVCQSINKIKMEERMQKTNLSFVSFAANVKMENVHVKIGRGGGVR